MYKYGKQVFISHRGGDYNIAKEFREILIEQKLCKYAILFPNESLCYNWEQLLVIEYFELMESITDYIASCDTFFYIENPNYENGYFTQAEILQWRRFAKNPIIHPVQFISEGHFQIKSPIELQPISKEDKRLWAKLSVNINPKLQGRGPIFWGKYAYCFLIGCCNCGEYILITKKLMDTIIDENNQIECPHCHKNTFSLKVDVNKKKKFYRHPIIMSPKNDQIVELRLLYESEIIALLIGKELPENFKLLKLQKEQLKTSAQEVGKFYGIAGAILAGIGIIAKILSDKDDK